MKWFVLLLSVVVGTVAVYIGKAQNGPFTPLRNHPIRVACSDTLFQLAMTCSEDYQTQSRRSMDVNGGGSSFAIEGLIQGNVDAAFTARRLTNDEYTRLKQSTGQAPSELQFGYFAMAVIVAKDSPLQTVSLRNLREIFVEGGSLDLWEQLDGSGLSGPIEQFAGISPSGTRPLLFDSILGEDDFGKKREVKARMPYVAGSLELVQLVSMKPKAIGYVGAAWLSDEVKALPLSHAHGTDPIALTPESVRSIRYPLSGSLYFITAGNPDHHELERFSQWLISERAQKILKQNGFSPLAEQ